MTVTPAQQDLMLEDLELMAGVVTEETIEERWVRLGILQ